MTDITQLLANAEKRIAARDIPSDVMRIAHVAYDGQTQAPVGVMTAAYEAGQLANVANVDNQVYADISDLAYLRIAKDALHRMNVGDLETAPPEIIELYKRCCRDVGALRSYFDGAVIAHIGIEEQSK